MGRGALLLLARVAQQRRAKGAQQAVLPPCSPAQPVQQRRVGKAGQRLEGALLVTPPGRSRQRRAELGLGRKGGQAAQATAGLVVGQGSVAEEDNGLDVVARVILAQVESLHLAAAHGGNQAPRRLLPVGRTVAIPAQHAQRYVQPQRVEAHGLHQAAGPPIVGRSFRWPPLQPQLDEGNGLLLAQQAHFHQAAAHVPGQLALAGGDKKMRAGRQRRAQRLDGRQRPDVVQHHQQPGMLGQQAAHSCRLEDEELVQVIRQAEEAGGIAGPGAQHRLRLVGAAKIRPQLQPDHAVAIAFVVRQLPRQQLRQGGLAHAGRALHGQRLGFGGLPGDGHAGPLGQGVQHSLHFLRARHGVPVQRRRRRPRPPARQVRQVEVVDHRGRAAALGVRGKEVLVAARLVQVAAHLCAAVVEDRPLPIRCSHSLRYSRLHPAQAA